MTQQVFIDGISADYPDDGFMGMPLGQVNCARIDHGLQDAVDPDTGEPQAVEVRMYNPATRRHEAVRMWRNGAEEPSRRGMCFACWRESHSDKYASCPLHMVNQKIPGVDECPICYLDPKERARAEAHRRKMEFVEQAETDDAEPEPDEPREAAVLVAPRSDAVARADALARRIAARNAGR